MNAYRRLVKEAWKILEPSRYDGRDFLTTVKDLKHENERLQKTANDRWEELKKLKEELRAVSDHSEKS